jgi:hypothetical protein
VRVDATVVERLARAIHDQYLREQEQDGIPMGTTPTMTSWGTLSEDGKEANRDQARDMLAKLDRIGCSVEATAQADVWFAFTEEELDMLARHEQVRWAKQRLSAGWVYGPVRDDEFKRHPSLVPWDQLSESERNKDRRAVRNIPAVLAAARLRVSRVH